MPSSILRAATVTVALVALCACAATRTQQSAGEQIDHTVLTAKVKAALIDDPATKARQIEVDTFRATVQLNGFVDTADEKAAATRVAHSVNGVQNVRNNLAIGHTDRSAGEVVDDGVVTTKVNASRRRKRATSRSSPAKASYN